MLFDVVLVLVLACGGAPVFGCAPCNCYYGEPEDTRYDWEEYQIAHCDIPNTFTSVPDKNFLPHDTQELRLKKQSIRIIQENQFITFPRLQIILLTSSKISEVENHAFRNMTKVFSISLFDNLISTLPTQLFSDTPNLKHLNLSRNKLKVLQSYLLSNLKKLEQVWVRYNQITSVEDNCFVNVPLFSKLIISANKLKSLNLNMMDNPSNLRELYPGAISWHCDKSLCEIMGAWVYGKLYDSLGKFSGPKCATPENLKEVSWYKAVSQCNLPLHPGEHTCGPCSCTKSPPGVVCSTPYRLNIPLLIEYVPEDIIHLKFTDQRMRTIHQNEFSIFQHLQKLYLDRNYINTIEPNAFYHLRNLSIISLNNNNLTVLNSFQFANLLHLKVIDLSYNDISFLEKNCFFNVPSLDTVNLSFNRLETLQLNIFSNKNMLKSFWLHNNPWYCDESLCELMNDVLSHELWGEKDVPTCAAPPNLIGKPWNQMLLEFQPEIIPRDSSLNTGDNLFLQCKYCFVSQIIWTLDGKKLSENYQQISKRSLISTLTLNNISREQEGNYKCQVKNCDTCDEMNMYVNVKPFDKDCICTCTQFC